MGKLKNVVIVNDFDYVQGGASKVAIDTANILKSKYPELQVYFFSGDTNSSSTLDETIKRVCTGQGEFLKYKNKIKGIIYGMYNRKAKEEFRKMLSNLDNTETIIHVHGWTKCLSSSIFDIAFKMNFKIVLTMHDYFTACPNGGYYNFQRNEICNFKPLSLKCVKCNCDSRNYFFKLYRVCRQFIQNKIVKLNVRLTDVISISDFSERILKQTLDSNVKIHRVYNPIDLEKNSLKVDYKNNKYYLYVGRVSKEKGVDIFCKAISELNLNGVVVGDGSELDKLKKEYPTIEFVGWKSGEEVKKYMKNAKALIFPSRWYEVAPLTPLETLQYGIPCLVSRCCAASEYVKDGAEDCLFDDIYDLKEKIKKINFNGDNYININNFHQEFYGEEIIKVYTRVLI